MEVFPCYFVWVVGKYFEMFMVNKAMKYKVKAIELININ
jgi:hypothetical protein